jgi:methanogenic corrinoid protein MtbC1
MSAPTLDELREAIVTLDEAAAHALTTTAIGEGDDPSAILEAARAAMEEIGRRFETGEAFLPELLVAGEVMSDVAAQVAPLLQAGGGDSRGCIVLGTVQGDIHDIGKNLVATQLGAAGYEVHDLGVDVAPETFVAKAAELEAGVVALSCLLTVGFDSMKRTVAALRDAGADGDRPRIMVGGAAVDESVRDHVGADGYGADVTAAVRLAANWMG